jgi:diguanylate cyclase (GGDEF)-like protein/PAS domain S-box-containing protein
MRAAQSLAMPAFQATLAPTPDHVRALEAALVSARAAEERFRGLVESFEAIPYISDWDALGTIRYISPQVERVLGYPAEEWYANHELWESSLHADDRDWVLADSERTYAEGRDFTCEYRVHAADGRVVWIAERETIVRDGAGRPSFCHGVMFDVTRLKTAEQRLVAAESALRAERDLAQRYLDVARTLLLVIDADETVRLLNQYGHELLGYPPGALIGCNWFDVAVPAGARERYRQHFRDAMAGRPSPIDGGAETLLVTASGEERTVAWRHALLESPDGAPAGTLSSAEDLTERLRHEAEIRRLAFHDPLTGLANRSHFGAELRAAIAGGEPVGLLFVDLDDFKLVNDTLGHSAGDDLLRAVAERLDAGAGLVGRHGGDEFLVLLRGLQGDVAGAARAAAAAVSAQLAEPYTIAGRCLRIEASVGSAAYPGEAADADALLGRADAAMYRAKRRAR